MDTPSRSLNLAGATNFRDLGGYCGEGGRRVRWRTVFRSDNLAGLTSRDRETLRALGLRRTLDFRGIHERAEATYHLPGVTQHSLSIEPTVVQGLRSLQAQGRSLTPEDAAEQMRQTYRGFVTDSAHRFGEFFRHLLDSDEPVVFHCTAGKDRTGFAAALFLSALGVPRETVMADFLLTNALYRREHAGASQIAPRAVMEVVWKVQDDFLEASLQALQDRHGDVAGFLDSIGVGAAERRELARRYLTD